MIHLNAWKMKPRQYNWKTAQPNSCTKDKLPDEQTDSDEDLSVGSPENQQSSLIEDKAPCLSSGGDASTEKTDSDPELRAIFGPPPIRLVSFKSTPSPHLWNSKGNLNVIIPGRLVPYPSSSDGTSSPPLKRGRPTKLSKTDRKLVQMKAEILAEVSLKIELFKKTINSSITTTLVQFKDVSDDHLEQYVTRRLEVMEDALDKQISKFMAGYTSDTQSLETRVAALEIQPSQCQF